MYRVLLAAVGIALILGNGAVHGVWTQRWAVLNEDILQEAGARLDAVPLQIGPWTGQAVELAEKEIPEEMVGRTRTIRYVNRTTGEVVVLFMACGQTLMLLSHTPVECYPAHGYTTLGNVTSLNPLGPGGAGAPEFSVATFGQPQAAAPVNLRIFWSFCDGTRWRTPENRRRAFRASPFVYKLYVMRQLVTPDEPTEGDGSIRFMADALPVINQALAIKD